MNASPAPRASSSITLAQDLRRTFPKGLIFGAFQGIFPVIFVLFGAGADLSQFVPSLITTCIIDFFASRLVARDTRSLRAGILTCLWADLVYLLGLLLTIALYFWICLMNPYVTIVAPSVAATPAIETFALTLLLSLLFGWLGGLIGIRTPAPRGPSPREAPPPVASAQLATHNQLGMLIRSYSSTRPSRALAFGIGTAVFVVVLFIIQRSLGMSGTSTFEDAVVTMIGIIATIYQANKRRGQQVIIYQHGVLVPGSDQQMIALRWEEIDVVHSRLEEQWILLQTKNGLRVTLTATFAGFADLKATIIAHLHEG